MFQISTLEDKAVRILPANLALTQLEAITQQLEATYVDKARARTSAAAVAPSALRSRAARAPPPRVARAATQHTRPLCTAPMRRRASCSRASYARRRRL